jgi:hypothetical protein
MLEIVTDDLLEVGIMKRWSSDWRYLENFQYLFERLSNAKNAKCRAELLTVGEWLLANKYISQPIKKKIRLMKNLGKEGTTSRNEKGNQVRGQWERKSSIDEHEEDLYDEEEEYEGDDSSEDGTY